MRFVVMFLILTAYGYGQTNMSLLSQQDIHGNAYANIWGYVDSAGNEYALLTCQTGTSIVNVTNPAQPSEIDFISAPSSSWHEIQVWDRYAYVVSEGGRGVQIIYLGQLPDTSYLVKEYYWSGSVSDRAHALQVRDGFAYLTGGNVTAGQSGNAGGLRILDLSDPVNPVSVGTWDSLYVHDCYVRNDTVYAACIYDGLVCILDARTKSSIRTVVTHGYPNGFTHNVALSDNGQVMMTTDETSSPPGMLRLWDISTVRDGIPNNTNITQLGSFGTTAIVHNVYAKGRYAFASYYTEGVRIWDVTNPSAPNLAGHYDTYGANNSAGFNGAWGVYPFFPSGNIVVSDISSGLFVIGFTQKEVGSITGTVTDQMTGVPIEGVKLYLIEDSHVFPSDAAGQFQLRSISGRSRVKLVRDGYLTAYQDVVIPVNSSSMQNFTMTPDTIPNAPNGVAAIAGDGQITLRWNRSREPDFSHYRIFGGTMPLPTTQIDSVMSVTDTVRTYTGLSNGTPYYYRLKTVDTSGRAGDFSTEVSATPIMPVPFSVNIALFSNSALPDYGDFILSSNEPLVSNPALTIAIDGDTTQVELQPIGSSTKDYYGPFRFESSGSYVVSANVQSLAGIDSVVTKTYDVGLGKSQAAITSKDGRLVLNMLTRAPGIHFLSKHSQGYEVGIAGDSRAVLEFSIDGNEAVIVREQDGQSTDVPTHVIPSRRRAAATISEDGVYRVESRSSVMSTEIRGFGLQQNFPNPFNPTTDITYDLDETANVSLIVYNVLGQKIRVLENGRKGPGRYRVTWDARDTFGKAVTSGVYIYRVEQGNLAKSRKMMLLR
jgi:choice-of-anchor B domain-containing protein